MTTSPDGINLPLTRDQLMQVLDGNVVQVEVPDADTGVTVAVVFVRLAVDAEAQIVNDIARLNAEVDRLERGTQ